MLFRTLLHQYYYEVKSAIMIITTTMILFHETTIIETWIIRAVARQMSFISRHKNLSKHSRILILEGVKIEN